MGALNAGMQTAWVNRAGHAWDARAAAPHVTVTDLLSLCAQLVLTPAPSHRDMSLTIYGIAASRAVRPLWVATELGLDFEHVPTPYQGGATRTPEFLALNPNGHIPVVVDARPRRRGGLGEHGLRAVPRAPPRRGRWRQHHAGHAARRRRGPALELLDRDRSARTDALTVLMHRVAMPPERRKPELADAAERRLRGAAARAGAAPARSRRAGEAHSAAERFTVADLCVASVLDWARPARELMAAHPAVNAWLGACMERPAYRALRGETHAD